MDKLDPRYEQFLIALQYVAKNNWYRQIGALAQEAMISQGYLSGIINGKKQASYDKQISIAEASGYNYESFLQLGHDLIQQKNGFIPTTEHRSIKQTKEKCKDDTLLMDEDIKVMLLRYDKIVESLEQEKKILRADIEMERQEHKDVIATVRSDLERERQAHEHAIAELREDYKELKAENKELRLEYKQLLDQYRALKQKQAQSSQSPDKPEEKKAVNL